MNWKNEAVEKLKNYAAMRTSLESIPQELKQLALDAEKIRTSDPSRISTRGVGTAEDALLSNFVRQQELENALSQAKCWVTGVDKALQTLSKEEHLVLEKLYLYPKLNAVDHLCELLCTEKSSVYRRREQALRHFTTALYGRIDS